MIQKLGQYFTQLFIVYNHARKIAPLGLKHSEVLFHSLLKRELSSNENGASITAQYKTVIELDLRPMIQELWHFFCPPFLIN